MKNHTLWQTNLLICMIIITGFIITSIISYHSNIAILEGNVEAAVTLSPEALYSAITTIFTHPVNMAIAMAVHQHLVVQLAQNIAIIIVVIVLVLIVITNVIKHYNLRISELTVSQELEYQRLLNKATGGLYDNIYELDITHNCAGGQGTKEYFEKLGMSPDIPYNKALHIIAEKQIKKEYIQGYIDTFSPAAVLEAYKNGISNLSYDFMITEDGENYHWTRIASQIFYWHSDDSIRMITYRKNINVEKKRELALLEAVQKDQMTGLYNKPATEEMVTAVLEAEKGAQKVCHALLILDIDNFKNINDTLGHSYGDFVISEIAEEIKTQFRENDIVGRIGGDEFAVLMKDVKNDDGLKQKLMRLCARVTKKNLGASRDFGVTSSIGVALFPKDGQTYSELYEKADQALYHAKSHGKNSFTIFGEGKEGYSFHTNQRDLEALINAATDGIAQYAFTDPIKLLSFNQKSVELFGIPAKVLSDDSFNPLNQIHPEDVEAVKVAIQKSAEERKPFIRSFRVKHYDGHYIIVKLQGIFVSEFYQKIHPIFYVMYTYMGNAS